MAGAYAGAQLRAVEVAGEKRTHLCSAVLLLAHVIFDGFGVIKVILDRAVDVAERE